MPQSIPPASPFSSDPVSSLLLRLGWPMESLANKGMMQWQASRVDQNSSALPTTASLVVTPRYIRGSVLNMEPADDLKPHHVVEWDITSGTPVLDKHVLIGELVPPSATGQEDTDRAVKAFTSLIAVFRRTPQLTLMGTRVKASQPTLAPSEPGSPSPGSPSPGAAR